MSTPNYTNNAEDKTPQEGGYSLVTLAIIIIFGIFATTLPQPQSLGKLPLQHLLKTELHVSREQMAGFFFLCGLAWYFKPFAGILTDAFPLFKTRRRHYLLVSSVLACVSWIALAFVPHTYNALLLGCIIVNVFMVIASTVTGGFLVEAGQRLGATGRLSALRQVITSVCGLINGPLAGLLASGAFAVAAGVNAAIVVSVFPIAWIFLREKPQAVANADAFHNAGAQLKTIFRSRNLWFAILFIGLFYFSPGFTTPLYYRQTDELKFSQQFIGNLGVFSSGAGLLGAALYGVLIRKLSIRTMIMIGVVTGAAGTLLYLFYTGATNAMMIETQNGFFFTLAEVALLDLAARATPKGCEALGYSLILSMRNIALFGADIVGSHLSDNKWPFADLVYLNAGTTAVVLILLPFLPRALMQSRDKA